MRLPKFQTEISIIKDDDQRLFVRKRSIHALSLSHIQNIQRFTLEFSKTALTDDIKVLQPSRVENNSLIFPYVKGESWSSILIKEYRKKGLNALIDQIKNFQDRIENCFDVSKEDFDSSLEFEAVFKRKLNVRNISVQKSANIDMIYDNFIETADGSTFLIDCEWVFPFSIPISFNLYRSLKSFWRKHKHEIVSLDFHELLQRVGISSTLIMDYEEMDKAFQTYVHERDVSLQSYIKQRISVNELYNQWVDSHFYVKVYLPKKKEYYVVKDARSVVSSKFNQLEFKFEEDVEDHVRIDLVPFPCLYEISSITLKTESGEWIYSSANSFKGITFCEQTYRLKNQDRLILLATDSNTHLFAKLPSGKSKGIQILIDFCVIQKLKEELIDEINMLQKNRIKSETIIEEITTKYNLLKISNDNLIKKYNEATANIEALNIQLRNQESENEHLKKSLKEEELKSAQLEDELSKIKNTKIWRVYSKFFGRFK